MTYNEELQSNNAELEEVLQAVNELPEAGSGTSVQADWNQTDETAADFIKNKPLMVAKEVGTLTWGYGNVTEDDLLSPEIPLFKISNKTATEEDLFAAGGLIATVQQGDGSVTIHLTANDIMPSNGAGVSAISTSYFMLYFVEEKAVGVDFEGLIFYEAGAYALYNPTIAAFTVSVAGIPLTTYKFNPSYLYQPDWDQPDESQPDAVKNKPFGAVLSEAGDTITWDGVFEGLVATEEQENEGLAVRAVKISPNVITAEDVASGVSVGTMTIGGTIDTTTVPAEEAQAAFQDDGFAIIGTSLYFVPKAGYKYTSNDITLVFPEPGIYSLGVLDSGEHSFAALYVTSLTIPGYGKLRGYSVKRISDYYLPESFAYIRIRSNTIGSSKVFMLTVNDSGTLSASEVTT